jgi:SAM-dependent methyltransferase
MTARGPDHDPEADATRLSRAALAAGEPTGWFEPLYAAAQEGQAIVPWDRGTAHPMLTEWAAVTGPQGAGRRAVVVGAGPGHDAELLSGLGFATTAFDVSPTAIHAARARFPGTSVDYVVADLLELPLAWRGAFDLVVEIMTVQALPDPPRASAIQQVATLVAPGGTLLVVASAREDGAPPDGPPWPLTREEVEAFAAGGLDIVAVDRLAITGAAGHRWRAELRRP